MCCSAITYCGNPIHLPRGCLHIYNLYREYRKRWAVLPWDFLGYDYDTTYRFLLTFSASNALLLQFLCDAVACRYFHTSLTGCHERGTTWFFYEGQQKERIRDHVQHERIQLNHGQRSFRLVFVARWLKRSSFVAWLHYLQTDSRWMKSRRSLKVRQPYSPECASSS